MFLYESQYFTHEIMKTRKHKDGDVKSHNMEIWKREKRETSEFTESDVNTPDW